MNKNPLWEKVKVTNAHNVSPLYHHTRSPGIYWVELEKPLKKGEYQKASVTFKGAR